MLVVCDTTPINYLLQIEQLDILRRLFTHAYMPSAVLGELRHSAAPQAVQDWANTKPFWIVVRDPRPIDDPQLRGLDKGERYAIALAEELGAQFLLTDDYKARVTAHRRGLDTLTTLLLLDAAADRGWLSFSDELGRLLKANFRVDHSTTAQLLHKHAKR